MSVLCIVVAVGQQVVQRTGFDWFKRTPLTFVNNYPNKRELFKIVDGGDGRKKKKILGILGGGGGTFQAHADDGMVFGWRRVTKTGSSGKAKEESVAVTKELRPTFVLGSEAPSPTTWRTCRRTTRWPSTAARRCSWSSGRWRTAPRSRRPATSWTGSARPRASSTRGPP